MRLSSFILFVGICLSTVQLSHSATLIANTSIAGSAFNSMVTSAIDTTGATLLVILVDAYGVSAAAIGISDSKGNTWHALTNRASTNYNICIFYAYDHGGSSLSVGSGHTFTAGSGLSFGAMAVMAFDGTITTDPFDVENGNFTNSSGATLTTGSISPSASNEVIVTGISHALLSATIDSGFTDLDDVAGASGSNLAISDGYKLTSSGSENPTWTLNASDLERAAAIAAFKVPGGGVQTTTPATMHLMGLGG